MVVLLLLLLVVVVVVVVVSLTQHVSCSTYLLIYYNRLLELNSNVLGTCENSCFVFLLSLKINCENSVARASNGPSSRQSPAHLLLVDLIHSVKRILKHGLCLPWLM